MLKLAAMATESGSKLPPQMEGFISSSISNAMSYIFTGSLVIVAIAFVTISSRRFNCADAAPARI